MATTASISLTLLSLIIFSAGARCRDTPPTSQDTGFSQIIHETCKASRDPPTCKKWLSASSDIPPTATVLQVIHSALRATGKDLERAGALVQAMLDSSVGNVNQTRVASSCLDMVRYAQHRVGLTGAAVELQIKDARAWLSAALGYEHGCLGGLKNFNDTAQVVQIINFFNSTLISGTSAALGMLFNYDIYGDKTDSWGPAKTERDGFWEPTKPPSSSSQPLPGGVPPDLKEDVTVCIAGNACTYKTVQEAVNAAPNNTGSGKRFVIRIRAGVYSEMVRIPLEKTNVVLLGGGMGKTVISGKMIHTKINIFTLSILI